MTFFFKPFSHQLLSLPTRSLFFIHPSIYAFLNGLSIFPLSAFTFYILCQFLCRVSTRKRDMALVMFHSPRSQRFFQSYYHEMTIIHSMRILNSIRFIQNYFHNWRIKDNLINILHLNLIISSASSCRLPSTTNKNVYSSSLRGLQKIIPIIVRLQMQFSHNQFELCISFRVKGPTREYWGKKNSRSTITFSEI